MRESEEEAGVPDGSVRARLVSVLDLGFWSYATLVADVVAPFEPVISDPESVELSWVPVDEVDGYPLHPAFAASWARLRELLQVRPVIVVDAANVVGAVPDGWWRDRAGAAERLIDRVGEWAAAGVAGSSLGLPENTWYPEVVVVLEGRAKDAALPASGPVTIVHAPGHGDDEIVARAAEAVASQSTVTVVTSDRGLAARAEDAGAAVHGARWLLDLLDAD
jgi:hypothetical protein